MAKVKVFFGNKKKVTATTWKLYVGAVQITTMYVGSTAVSAAYVGLVALKI